VCTLIERGTTEQTTISINRQKVTLIFRFIKILLLESIASSRPFRLA
jgi:hypothetical protein